MKVLHLVDWWPTKEHPNYGIFIKRHVDLTRTFADVQVAHGISDLIYKLVVFRPDLVHVHVLNPNRHPLLKIRDYSRFLFLFKTPYIISEHNTEWVLGKKANWIDKLILTHAKRITAVSESLYLAIHKQIWYIWYNNHVLPNVISSEFKPNLHPVNKPIRAIHVSSLYEPQKNVKGILKALDLINIPIHLTIIGNGIHKKFLESLARVLQLDVTFIDHLDQKDLIKELQQSDFFILNSNYETFSVVTAEALACGLPCVVTKCGGPEEFVNDSNGIVTEKQNQNALNDAIIQVIINILDKKYDSNKISQDALSRFGEQAITNKLKQLYAQAISNTST